MKVKGVYVGRYSDQTKTYTLCKDNNKKMKEDIDKMGVKLRALNAKPGERNKLNAEYGPWYVLHQNGWGYAVCTTEGYPERHVYGLIDKIKSYIDNNQNKAQGKFHKELKKIVEENAETYSDVAKIDKVHKATAEVNLLQQDLQTGVRKLITNQQDLAELDDKAAGIKIYAQQFKKKATALESATFWHKWKFILIIVLIILGMVSLVAVTIMIKY